MLHAVWEDLRRQYESGNMVTRIILINLAAFLFFRLLWLVLFVVAGPSSQVWINDLLNWFSVSGDWLKVLTRPWTLVTHIFLHFDFFHFLWNMLFLYWFGRILQDLIGNHRILAIYVISGLAGFVAFFATANLLPSVSLGSYALGASAAIMGVILAAAVTAPHYTIHLILIGQVKLMYVALFVVLLDLISIPTNNNTGGHFAHLGGALMGWLLVQEMKRGNDWTERFNVLFEKISKWVTALFRRQQPKVVYKNPNAAKTERPANKGGDSVSYSDRQARVDKILEKIKESGYEKLTEEEKEFLFKVSKDDK